MQTQVIMGVLFWSALVLFSCWIVVELSQLVRNARKDAEVRTRLGLDERPGESAWEERMRIDAEQRAVEADPARRR
jgi:type III secretory pathway component EscV